MYPVSSSAGPIDISSANEGQSRVTSADRVPEDLFESGPPMRLHRMMGFVGKAGPSMIRRAVATIMVGWAPVYLLAVLGTTRSWGVGFGSFAWDVAFHARSLVAAPLLVMAEGICAVRLGRIAQHFLDAGLVPRVERARFEAAIDATLRLRDSSLAELVVGLLAYAASFALNWSATASPAWRLPGHGPLPIYSPAGWWQALVSLPLLLAIIFGWLWRVILWARFLWRVSRMKLRLVAAHPDLTAGLKFVGYSARAFAPVALGFGFVVAGLG